MFVVTEEIRLAFFIFSVLFIAFVSGWLVSNYQIFPSSFLKSAIIGFNDIHAQVQNKRPAHHILLESPFPEPAVDTPPPGKELTLVTASSGSAEEKDFIDAKIIDQNGQIIHQWRIDWFELWPDPYHLTEKMRPKSRPGTMIHGAHVMENGDLIFNFEEKGMIRLNLDSEVVWRLPYQTHHSLHIHDDGNLWAAGLRYNTEKSPYLPHLITPITPSNNA